MNEVVPGSIVKITGNDLTIYAKVLWNMEDIKENNGINFRISEAAASQLQLRDSKFPLTIQFYK